jgi:hypothetical protein
MFDNLKLQLKNTASQVIKAIKYQARRKSAVTALISVKGQIYEQTRYIHVAGVPTSTKETELINMAVSRTFLSQCFPEIPVAFGEVLEHQLLKFLIRCLNECGRKDLYAELNGLYRDILHYQESHPVLLVGEKCRQLSCSQSKFVAEYVESRVRHPKVGIYEFWEGLTLHFFLERFNPGSGKKEMLKGLNELRELIQCYPESKKLMQKVISVSLAIFDKYSGSGLSTKTLNYLEETIKLAHQNFSAARVM